MFTQIVYDTKNKGYCRWKAGYIPNNLFECTRELAACDIVNNFYKDDLGMHTVVAFLQTACIETQAWSRLVNKQSCQSKQAANIDFSSLNSP